MLVVCFGGGLRGSEKVGKAKRASNGAACWGSNCSPARERERLAGAQSMVRERDLLIVRQSMGMTLDGGGKGKKST
jgi:hypothetical protein